MDPFHIMMTAFALMLMVIVLTPFIKAFFLAIRSIARSMKKTFNFITSF